MCKKCKEYIETLENMYNKKNLAVINFSLQTVGLQSTIFFKILFMRTLLILVILEIVHYRNNGQGIQDRKENTT